MTIITIIHVILDNFISNHHNVIIIDLLCVWLSNDAVHGYLRSFECQNTHIQDLKIQNKIQGACPTSP